MDKQQAVAIVIPALNPGPLLLDQLRQLQQGGLTAIVVVDDGSAEAAQPVFTRAHGMGVTVLHHAVNLGKGAALKTGFAHCLRSWPELIGCVTADADGQHTVRDILRMAAALRGCPGALWLGVRNFSAPNVPLRSRWGNCLSAAALRLGGVKVQDSQTGLRAIPAALLPLLMRLPGSRYEYETTMLLAARRAGWPLEELEIETVYTDGNRGSHFHPLRDSLRVIGVLLHGISSMAVRFAASSLASAGVDLGLFALLAPRLAPCGGWRMAAVALGVRVASAGVNFVLNRTLVFGVHRAVARPAVRYALLCAGQAAASAGLTSLLYAVVQWPAVGCKALVDGALFIISFFLQQRWVFRVPAVREEEANI